MINILLFPYKLIFYYPARIILWFSYFFPQKNKKKGGFISVAESRRQYKEGGYLVHFIVSCIFWGPVALVLLQIVVGN